MSIFAPSSNSFRGESQDEKTILVTRKHRIRLLAPLYTAIGIAMIPLFIFLGIKAQNWYYIFSSLFWFLYFIYLLALWSAAFYNVMIYYLNNVILTNKRIIENQQRGFFNHVSNEVELSKIQDVSVEIKGSVAHFLDFGNVEIQSAGAEKKFIFTELPYPEKIKEEIMQLKMKDK